MNKTGLGILVLLAALAGCAEEQIDYFDCSVCDKDFAVPEEDLVAELVTGNSPTGSACTRSDECQTGECFCEEASADGCTDVVGAVEGMGAAWTYVFPGGMCSQLSCDPAASDSCGNGNICLSLSPLLKAEAPVGVCVKSCQEYFDCRYDEGFVCYYTGVEGQRACLPADLVADIPCGNGTCDEDETADTCPRDCK